MVDRAAQGPGAVRVDLVRLEEVSRLVAGVEPHARDALGPAVRRAHEAASTEDGRSALGSEQIPSVPQISARLAKIYSDVDHNLRNVADAAKDAAAAVAELRRRHIAMERRTMEAVARLRRRPG